MRDRPIYHITHIGNLPSVLASGRLWCDAQCRRRGCTANDVGYSHIKDRRMRRQVSVHPETTLGQFVPFNFCSRSVMLYVLHKGHDGYRGGQNEILHLVSTVGRAIDCGHQWAFTDRHADLGYAEYFNALDKENEVDWGVMPLQYWSNENETKERRQAEFLVYDWFPWEAINEIGVMDRVMQRRVEALLTNSEHWPAVRVKPGWYY
jgi:hypothetical protein